MATKYAAEIADTLAALKDDGGIVTFHFDAVPGDYDPLTGWSEGEAAREVKAPALQVPADPDRFAALNLILRNPVLLMVAAKGLGFTPAPGRKFTWAGTLYSTETAEPFAPDGEPIFWTLAGGV
jgi:hypothetical protein